MRDEPRSLFYTDLHAYRWDDGVEVELERLKEGSDSFTARMIVQHRPDAADPDSSLIYGPSSINLVAPQTVTTTAKTLNGEFSSISVAEWKNRLKHIAYASLKAYQEGTSRLLHADEIEIDYNTPPALLPPLIAGSGVTLWYADSSVGKTTIAEAALVSVVTGAPTLGLTPTLNGPGVLFDWEDNEETFKERVQAICEAAQIPVPHDLYYRQMDRSILSGEARIRRECEEIGVALAVFDSVGEMLGGDPSDPTLVIPAVNVMKRIGCPALGLHHISAEQAKSTDLKDKQKGYGSVYIRSGARLQWYFDRFQEEEADEGYLYAHNTKVNRGKKSRPLSWTVEYESDGDSNRLTSLRYSTRPANDYFERLRADVPVSSMTVKDACLHALDAWPVLFSIDGLHQRVQANGKACERQSVVNALNALVKEGRATATGAKDDRRYMSSRHLSDRNEEWG